MCSIRYRTALEIALAAVIAVAGLIYLGQSGPGDLPKGGDLALMEAPALRLGLEAFRRGDRQSFDTARDLLDRLIADQEALAGAACTRPAIVAAAARSGRAMLAFLAGEMEQPEMVRFAWLRKILADGNRRHRDDCVLDQYRALEQILPGAAHSSLDPANQYYREWRAALQKQLGADYPTARDAAIRQSGADTGREGENL